MLITREMQIKIWISSDNQKKKLEGRKKWAKVDKYIAYSKKETESC